MKKIQSVSYGVTNKVVHTASLSVDRVQGYFRGATDVWLQFHDAKALPANGAVPIKSYFQPASAAFHWGYDPGELVCQNGLVVVMSTTEGTLTASADLSDFFVDGESSWDDTGMSVAGNYTAGASTLTIWADGLGPKTLHRLEFTALSAYGANAYAKLFATESPNAGQMPLATMKLINNTSADFFFNVVPFNQLGATQQKAGYVAIEDNPGGYVIDTSVNWAIKATYK